MKLKEFILKTIIVVLLIVITRLLDVFIFVEATEYLWLACGYVIYLVINIEEED